jgi:hypothetical protein
VLRSQSDGELHHAKGEDPSILAINGLHDVEEDIWSPKWGLKGKVDASVQVNINRNPSKVDSVVEENVAPLEIKTGRSVGVMAHRAQTMLYTLLMEDRYGDTFIQMRRRSADGQVFLCQLVYCTILNWTLSYGLKLDRTRFER